MQGHFFWDRPDTWPGRRVSIGASRRKSSDETRNAEITMVANSRLLFFLAGLLAVSVVQPALAQRGSREGTRTRGDNARAAGRSRLPEKGTQLPIVKAVDDQGQEFSTASLRGSHTVLVFGCLT